MLDDTNKLSETDHDASPTPRIEGEPAPLDQTIRLDRSIAQRGLSTPATFGRYEVIKRIGIGGFASVFSARDPKLDATVAIKVLAENHSASTDIRRRFVAEARVARRLASDRLVRVFDLGETDDGRPFVVMELATGGTLRARVSRTGRPSKESLLRLIDELGACMIAIHAKDLIHRDIKPSNLLLRSTATPGDQQPSTLIGPEEHLVLGDLGLARDISEGASALTVGGGTAGYMAPEQANPDGKADSRADIYASTVVLAELSTGRHPERLDLSSARVTPEVRRVLERGISLDREQRPPSAVAWRDEMLAAYETFEYPQPKPTGADRSGPQQNGGADDDETAIALSSAAVSPSDATGRIDPTKVHAPYPYNTSTEFGDLSALEAQSDSGSGVHHDEDRAGYAANPAVDPDGQTNVLADAATDTIDAPRTWVKPPADTDGPPPPPPSIPLSPRIQRPRPDAEPPSAPNRAVAKERDGAGATEIPQTQRVTPRPPVVPRFPASNQPQPATEPVPGAVGPAAVGPLSPPIARPVVEPTVQPTTPTADRRPNPPRVGQINRPHPPSAARIPQQAPPPNSAQRVAPPGIAPATAGHPLTGPYPGAVSAPAQVGAGAVVVEQPTKRQRKLDEKAARRHARMRRRRRRRRRFSNFIRALLRGFFAALLTLIIASIVATAANGTSYQELPDSTVAVINIAVFATFVLGIRFFPRPRRLDVDA